MIDKSDPAFRHKRSILIGMLAVLLAIAVGFSFYYEFNRVGELFEPRPFLISYLGGILCLTAALLLAVFGHLHASALVAIAVFTVFPILLALPCRTEIEQLNELRYLLLPVLLASAFLGTSWTVVSAIMGAVIIGLWFPLITGEPTSLTAFGYACFQLIIGSLIAVVAVHRNRLERARLLQLTEEKTNFRAIAECAVDGVAIADADGKHLFVNTHFAEITAYSAGELMDGVSVGDLVPSPERAKILSYLRDMVTGKSTVNHFESSILTKTGQSVPIEVSAAPITWQGKAAFLGIIRDISSRKREEAERDHLLARLHQAEKLEAIGHLAGGVAHDFNNQLQGILGHADLLRHSTADPQAKEYAEDIYQCSRRAAELTDQLLAFARKGKYRKETVDMNLIVGEVVSLLRRLVDKRITVTARIGADNTFALGDPGQLQSAILNMGINARDAMPAGGTLTIATDLVTLADADPLTREFGLTPGRFVCIEVTDTGEGMDEVVARRVFEPFFTTKPKGKGTGMGLAAVYGTARNHGGGVAVESALGSGSTFRLYLPHYSGPLDGKEESAAAVVATDRKARILVVDDEPLVRKSIARCLGGLGYEAETSSDGPEALALYKDKPGYFDAVILDMVMPKMSGREVFEALRNVNPNVRVLLSSGYSSDQYAREMLSDGVVGFISKPFTLDMLSKAVADAVGNRAQG